MPVASNSWLSKNAALLESITASVLLLARVRACVEGVPRNSVIQLEALNVGGWQATRFEN